MPTAAHRRPTARRLPRGAHAALVAALAAAGLLAAPHLAAAAPKPPDVPAAITPPAGSVLTAVGRAEGFQIYACQLQPGGGFGWSLQQPMAVLAQNGYKPFALHFGGPTWLAMDGSRVTATRVDGVPSPSGAIPWLLLKATSNDGPQGGTFAATTYIQRVNTTGGLAPSTGCATGQDAGLTVPVSYTADYYFYRAG